MEGERLMIDSRKRARNAVIIPLDEDADVDDASSTVATTTCDTHSSNFITALAKSSPPVAFMCPLALEIMFEPVLDREGNSFEREAILKFLEGNAVSPISRMPLNPSMLVPNNALREVIHEYMGIAWILRKKSEMLASPEDRAWSSACPYRDKVNAMLRSVTLRGDWTLCLALNEHGSAAFRCSGIVVVLDVPSNAGYFHLYTRELVLDPTYEIKDKMLELNFLQGETRGGCLSIKRDGSDRSEVVFSYHDRVDEVSCLEMRNILLNFVETALLLQDKLIAKTTNGASTVEDDD